MAHFATATLQIRADFTLGKTWHDDCKQQQQQQLISSQCKKTKRKRKPLKRVGPDLHTKSENYKEELNEEEPVLTNLISSLGNNNTAQTCKWRGSKFHRHKPNDHSNWGLQPKRKTAERLPEQPPPEHCWWWPSHLKLWLWAWPEDGNCQMDRQTTQRRGERERERERERAGKEDDATEAATKSLPVSSFLWVVFLTAAVNA